MDSSWALEGAREPDPLAGALPAAMPALLRFARRLTHERGSAEAEDLLQEAVARALRKRQRFEVGRDVIPWMKKLMVNIYIDQRRARPPVPSAVGPEPAGADPFEPGDLREWIETKLEALRPIERELLLGFHEKGESTAELARRFDLPEGTVKSHLHRARKRLARETGKDMP